MAGKTDKESSKGGENGHQQGHQQTDDDGDAGHKLRLLKSVSYLDAAALIIGFIIGSGIFISPQGVLKNAGSPGMAFIMWAVTGAITTLENFCYIELALTFPEMGGEYIYIKKGFGNMIAFLYMWVSWVFVTSAGAAIIALTFSAYFCQMFWHTCAAPQEAKALVAALAMSLLVAAQCLNPRFGYLTSDAFAFAKLAGLFLIIACGAGYLAIVGPHHLQEDIFANSSDQPGDYVLAFFAAYWAFSGTTGLFQIIEEVREPLKANIIKSVLLGMSTVTVIYLLANLAYISVLTPSEILASEAVAMTFGGKIFSGVFWVMPFIVACSTFGTMNNGILAGARTTIAAARAGHLPRFLSLIHVEKHTPVPAYLAKLFIGIGLLATSSVYDLIYYTVYVGTLASTMCQITLIMLRFTQPDLKRPFKLPLILPIIFLLLQLVFLAFPIYQRPARTALCFAFIASGIPIYFVFVWPKEAPNWARFIEQKITHVLQKLTESLPEGAEEEAEEEEAGRHRSSKIKDEEGRDNPAFDKEK